MVYLAPRKGSYCTVRSEGKAQGGSRLGTVGGPVGLAPSFTSSEVSSSSSLTAPSPACPSPWLLFYSSCLAQSLKIKRNLRSHLNPGFSVCGPQTSSRGATYEAALGDRHEQKSWEAPIAMAQCPKPRHLSSPSVMTASPQELTVNSQAAAPSLDK